MDECRRRRCREILEIMKRTETETRRVCVGGCDELKGNYIEGDEGDERSVVVEVTVAKCKYEKMEKLNF